MSLECPVITLKNGLRIANWSSPHPFTFTTGEILPECDEKRVKLMNLDITETILDAKGWDDVEIHIDIPQHVYFDLIELQDNPDIDIILVPFMVLNALKKNKTCNLKHVDKCRCIRMANRMTKTIYPDKFCL